MYQVWPTLLTVFDNYVRWIFFRSLYRDKKKVYDTNNNSLFVDYIGSRCTNSIGCRNSFRYYCCPYKDSGTFGYIWYVYDKDPVFNYSNYCLLFKFRQSKYRNEENKVIKYIFSFILNCWSNLLLTNLPKNIKEHELS